MPVRCLRKLDKDGDGIVTYQEAQEGLREQTDIPADALQRPADGLEVSLVSFGLLGILTGPDGIVSYSAFMAQMIGEEVLHEGVRLWDVFCELDLDGDGYLTREDAGRALGAGHHLHAV
eukprot:Skav222536  [mRNA]  locus=scaffold2875:173536:174939:+ [translate_table: standard]